MRRPPVIPTRNFPPSPYVGITLFGVVFLHRNFMADKVTINHEWIHCRQQLECLYLPFFIIYGAEWLWYLMKYHDPAKAYMSISYEREAYAHQSDFDYLRHRPLFANFRRRKQRKSRNQKV